MRVLPLVALFGLAAFVAPPSSGAQSLAEAAAKEKARRKALTPGKVYTEDDLRRAGASAPAATTSVPTDAASPAPADASAKQEGDAKAAPKAKSEDEVRAEQEKAWHAKLAEANAEVTRLNGEIAALEAALGDVRQNLYSTARTNEMTRLDEDKKQLAAAQQKVADLQEEGRRNSYR